MFEFWFIAAVLTLAVLAFALGRARALSVAGGNHRALHSLPAHYGWAAVQLTLLPALLLYVLMMMAGLAGPQAAAAALALALAGLLWALRRSRPDFRARNSVERVVMGFLILASTIAIATTAGIVLSMLFETRHFFTLYDWRDFFFSATWAPQFQGQSQLGILPLLWGTLYISLIALIFAVPVGLFAAIYMSEYAGRRMRALVKPALEILAGIPTIVYGLFALITVGPM
ncbi:MAG TPA: phosphate ABC transporter permease subunit PstC, partial [Paracoccus sp.]|nr:phosphate ABC transporter permease subunit PstC [Paracoccus sp. (in: a-proteobacteria)]